MNDKYLTVMLFSKGSLFSDWIFKLFNIFMIFLDEFYPPLLYVSKASCCDLKDYLIED